MMRAFRLMVIVLLVGAARVSAAQASQPESQQQEVQVTSQTIWRLPLPTSQTTPLVIPTWPDDTTYIELPEVVQDWFGRGFALEPRSQAGDFHLRVEIGGKRVGLVPLVAGARRTLHLVMADGRFLTLDLAPAAERRFAWRAIVFEDKARIVAAVEAAAAKERERLNRPVAIGIGGGDGWTSEGLARETAPPESLYQRASARTMDGMLALLRASVGLSAERVALFSRANPSLHIVTHPGTPASFGAFDLSVRTAIRDDITDTLGLVVSVTNLERNHTLLFDPAAWTIRVGERVYRFDAPGALVAFPGALDPGESDLAFLILARAPDGHPHRLMPDNDFRVTARLVDRRPTVPVAGYDLSSFSESTR
jgi:hypothetical protein